MFGPNLHKIRSKCVNKTTSYNKITITRFQNNLDINGPTTTKRVLAIRIGAILLSTRPSIIAQSKEDAP